MDSTRSRVRVRLDRNQYAAAESLAVAALAGGPSPADSAALIDQILFARWRNDRSRVAGTAALAERGLRIRLEAKPPDSLDIASSYESMAYQATTLGNAHDAEDFAWRAIALRRARLPADDERIARLVHHLGVVAWSKGNYRAASDRFAEALAMRERSSGPASSVAGRSLMALAGAHSIMGDAQRAAGELERAVAIHEAPATASTRDLLFALNSLAICYGRLDRRVEAAATAERAVRVAEAHLGPAEQTANAYISLAYAYAMEGDFARARDADRRALEIFQSGHGSPSQLVWVRRYLVGTLNNSGDYEEAAREAELALRDCEALDPPDSSALIEVCHGLGAAYQGLGRRSETRALYRRALAISEAKFGPDNPETAYELASVADEELDLGHIGAADSLFTRAHAINLRSLGADNSATATTFEGRGLVRQSRGQYAQAESLLTAARDVLERRWGPDLVETGRAYALLARLAATRGRRPEGMVAALRAETISRRQFHVVAQGLAEREALRATSAGCSTLPLMLAMASDSTGLGTADRRAVWDAVIRSRGQVLEEMARRRRADRIGDARSSRLVDSLRIARADLAALVMRGGDASAQGFTDRVAERRRDVERLEEALALSHAELRRDPRATRWAWSRSSAPPARRGPRLVRATPRSAAHRVGVAAPIDRHVRRIRAWRAHARCASSASAPRRDRLPARTLECGRGRDRVARRPRRRGAGARRRSRAAPRAVGSAARAARRRVTRADRARRPAPPGQLRGAARRPRRLSRRVRPHAPHAHGRARRRARCLAEPGHGLIALGDPRFDDAAPRTNDGAAPSEPSGCARRSRLWRVPPAAFRPVARHPRRDRAHRRAVGRVRVHRLARLVGVRRARGRQATETALERRASGRRVLHLATHGFFLDARCVAEGGAGTRGVGGMAPWSGTVEPAPRATTPGNPLLLSGLALTGANRRNERSPGEDDGILTAEELSTLDLAGLEWAVLSACRTGVGEVADGEGVFGLRRALRIAGARSVITSLWPVGDVTTQQWMVALYRARLVDRRSTAEAVRAASLAVLRDRRARGLGTSPITWGAFLAAGDWR